MLEVERAQGTLVLTTSYPRFEGDAAGHFVEAETRELAGFGPVRVLAAGLASGEGSGADAPALQWLGAPELFRSPGAWPRLREDPRRFWSLLRVLWRVRRALRDARERHVVAHWLLPLGLAVALANRRRKAKFEIEVVAHGSDVRLLRAMPSWIARLVVRSLIAGGARFRFVSEELKRELTALPGLSVHERAALERADVRAATLELPYLPGREQARKLLGCDENARLVVVVGRLITSKRVEVALRAAELVPETTIVVLGDGPERSALEAAFPNARFSGQLGRPETLLWMRAADLLVSASLLEGAPTVVREARALGTAVVSLAVGDTELWAKTDDDLWLVRA